MSEQRAAMVRRARNGEWNGIRDAVQLHQDLADALETSEAEKAKLIEVVRRIAEQTDYETADFLREACHEAEAPS